MQRVHRKIPVVPPKVDHKYTSEQTDGQGRRQRYGQWSWKLKRLQCGEQLDEESIGSTWIFETHLI